MPWGFRRLVSILVSTCAIISCLSAAQPNVRKIVAGAKCEQGEPRTDTASALVQGVSFTARPIAPGTLAGLGESRPRRAL